MYNTRAVQRGELTEAHLVALVRDYQSAHGLEPDGKAGPVTRAALTRATSDVEASERGLTGPGVELVLAHESWYGARMPRGPLAIVAHYTATDPGTARSLHTRRQRPRTQADRTASWHVTIAQDGTVYQMVPLDHVAWHCAMGWVASLRTNDAAIGIELEGHGDDFPEPQVAAACRVWRALVRAFAIPRERAMLEHSALDPHRRADPGPVWMRQHAPRVLDHAFEVRQ